MVIVYEKKLFLMVTVYEKITIYNDTRLWKKWLVRIFAVQLKTLKSLATHRVHCKDSGETKRMHKLIWKSLGAHANL